MAEITTEMVKELRAATNAGVLDCRKALVEANGNFDAAVEFLRMKGLSRAASKSSRDAREGTIGSYIHNNDKVAAMVKLQCETDFVARNGDFQQLARDLALHIVASRPLYVARENVPASEIEHERTIYREQMADSGKPAAVVDKIVDGKLDKWYSEVCLLEQPFVKDPNVTIQSLLTAAVAKLGENIRISGFSRLEIGEA